MSKTEAISLSESRRMVELERVVESGRQTFVEVANALAEIRDSRLYRSDFSTFEDYCRERWGWTRRHANRLIQAAAAVAGLPEDLGHMCPNARVAEAVASVPPESRAEVLAAVRDSGKPATAAQITLTAAELGKIHPKRSAEDPPSATPHPHKTFFGPDAVAAGEEAERDTPGLWRLKCLWKKTNKRDRAAFLAWINDDE